VEEKVETLYNQGLSASRIGIIMRDSYGVPSVALVTERKITKILEEKNKVDVIPEDLQNLMRKALKIRKHIEENKKDVHNKRALQLTESKIRRLVKYYRREKVLPDDWKYKPEFAEVVLRK
jgi:small subunit ribosomal protein S15